MAMVGSPLRITAVTSSESIWSINSNFTSCEQIGILMVSIARNTELAKDSDDCARPQGIRIHWTNN